MFSPDGNYLYSSARQDSDILCWDLRQTGEVLFRLPRPGRTNQRLSFDIDRTGRWLTTGDEAGTLFVYDLQAPTMSDVKRKALEVQAHSDAISAATFHPSWPLLLTSSGQRKFPLETTSVFRDASDEESDSSADEEGAAASNSINSSVDNSLKLWHLPARWSVWSDGVEHIHDVQMSTTLTTDAEPTIKTSPTCLDTDEANKVNDGAHANPTSSNGMSIPSSPCVPEAGTQDGNISASTLLPVEGSLEMFSGLERIILSSNSDPQQLLSAFFNLPIESVSTDWRLVDRIADGTPSEDRSVHLEAENKLKCNNQLVCHSHCRLHIFHPDDSKFFKSGFFPCNLIEQLRHPQRNPEFVLERIGRLPVDMTAPEYLARVADGRHQVPTTKDTGGSFFRDYTIIADGVRCHVRDVFPAQLFSTET